MNKLATNAQVQKFVKTWGASATDAAKQLGLPASWVMAQWGMETNWGTQPNMGKNNPGNVGNLGGGKWQDYSTQGSFVREYVASMKSDFPNLGVVNPTSADKGRTNVRQLMLQAFGGNQKYDPGNSTYGGAVYGAWQSLYAASGLKGKGTALWGMDNYVAGQPIPAIGFDPGALSGSTDTGGVVQTPSQFWNQSIGRWLNKAGLFIFALLLGIVGIFLLARDSSPMNKLADAIGGDGK